MRAASVMRIHPSWIAIAIGAACVAGGCWIVSKKGRPEAPAAQSSTASRHDRVHTEDVSVSSLQTSAADSPQLSRTPPPDHRARLGQLLLEAGTVQRTDRMLEELRRWASHDMRAAGEWLIDHLNDIPADPAFAALFHGAVNDPANAVVFADELAERLPDLRSHLGSCLIAALGNVGEHERAARFALEREAGNDPIWSVAAFHRWGEQAPREASVFTFSLPASARRTTAFHAMSSGWARNDPAGLAHAATTFPQKEEREFALITALRQWAARAPDDAADFMLRNGPLPRAALILED